MAYQPVGADPVTGQLAPVVDAHYAKLSADGRVLDGSGNPVLSGSGFGPLVPSTTFPGYYELTPAQTSLVPSSSSPGYYQIGA